MNRNVYSAGAITQIMRNIGLTMRLMLDSRVPVQLKVMVIAVLAYILSPLDLAPDIIPALGQLDDLAILLLGLKLFLDMSPKHVVEELRQNRRHEPKAKDSGNEYVDASYRVVDEEKK